MANREHVEALRQGAKAWNEYREKQGFDFPNYPDFRNADLQRLDLTGANLSGANLMYTDLSLANLTDVNLTEANLQNTDLEGAVAPQLEEEREGND